MTRLDADADGDAGVIGFSCDCEVKDKLERVSAAAPCKVWRRESDDFEFISDSLESVV